MNFNSSENIEMKSNKKSKMIKIAIVFLLLMLIVTYVVYSYYVKNTAKQGVKNEFFQNIQNNDLSFFTSNDLYTNILEKVEKNHFESSSDIKLSTTMENNMFSKLDLSKFEFNYYLTKNSDTKKYYSKIATRYAGNDLLTVDLIGNEKQFALKSDEIVNKYVGIEKSNTQNMANQLLETNVDLSPIKKLKNFILDREYVDLQNILESPAVNEYAQILVENIGADDFSKQENVIITTDSEQVNTTQYTVTLTQEEVKNILNNLSVKLENDHEFISELVVSDVQNLEEDDDQILEYTDNENMVEVSGEENNFQASVVIWGENTIAENAITENNTVDNYVTNQTINTVMNNTVESTNTAMDHTTVENEISDTNTAIDEVNQQTTQEQPEAIEQEPTMETPTDTVQEQEEQEMDNTIEEEDNFRRQGYISVNEDEPIEDQGIENEFIIGENYTDTIENIADFAEQIDWVSYLFTGAKVNMTEEELVAKLQEMIEDRMKQNHTFVIKMYVADEKTIKITFEIPETSESFDVQIISNSDNEKYLNITVLKGTEDKSNGYTISIYKKNSDAVVKNKININKIYNSKISQKIKINFDTKGTMNSKKYITTSDVSYSDSDGEFKIEIENTLNFDVNPEIEDLNNDNCLFMDTLSSEELLLTRDAIKEKILQVLSDKNKNLNIIDINNANSVVQQMEQSNVTTTEDLQAKEAAKQALIQTISNKMGEYQNNGTNLKIEDLEDLEVPGYEVNISISSNLAIITVNGYNFKLDSDFNLSDS